MRSVRVNSNGPANQRLAEPDHHTRGDKRKQVRGGVTGEGQGLSEEDESRINGDLVISNNVQQVQQKQHTPSQGSLVCWERFLPFRSLKVLLVENDDSTRHIVSALLRNCSYEVTAVSTGLEAWKIIQDITNRIDLVLSEVGMPCLSGMGLLYKIRNHKTCKNIPVIMMSSNDSMGIVFKCLSKGAVDFLVKPIRKNELKNLWQHVWRKCHSSSGSGSESGTRTLTSVKSKSLEESDGDTGRFDAEENVNPDLNIRDGNRSDNGSGTQSSWTKRAVAVDSPPRPVLTWDRRASSPDKTCAPVIHSNPKSVAKEYHGQINEYGNDVMGRDLEIGVSANTDYQLEIQAENMAVKENTSASERKEDGYEVGKEKMDLNCEMPNGELWKEVTDLTGDITNCTDSQMIHTQTEVSNDVSKENKNTAIFDTRDAPSLELSLKRRRDVDENEAIAQDRNVLRHSNLSPFSRYKYNSSSTGNQAPTGIVGSCSPLGNSSEAGKTEATNNLQSSTNGTGNQVSNGSSNNIDMGSTTDNDYTKQTAFVDKPTPKSAINAHPCSAFQPIVNNQVHSGKADAAAIANSVQVPPASDMQEVQVQHHHHHYHHHHHHVHNTQQQQKQVTGSNNLSLKTVGVANHPHSGQSNLISKAIEGKTGDGSASGSNNNGSNGQKGSSAEWVKASNDGVSGSGSGNGIDLNRCSQREAALNKFLKKRKERCFDKKVRYQSRKKLAEERPRVKGQFVRQNKSKDDHS